MTNAVLARLTTAELPLVLLAAVGHPSDEFRAALSRRLLSAFDPDRARQPAKAIRNCLRRLDRRRRGARALGPRLRELAVLVAQLAFESGHGLLISPYDALGETRQPNLPGTVFQYPNWRIPLPVSLEEMRDDPRIRVVVDELRAYRPRESKP